MTNNNFWDYELKDRSYNRALGNGLYIHVHPSGSRTWKFHYKIDRNVCTTVIGKVPEMNLDEAREIAARLLKLHQAGIDPRYDPYLVSRQREKERLKAVALKEKEEARIQAKRESEARKIIDSIRKRKKKTKIGLTK